MINFILLSGTESVYTKAFVYLFLFVFVNNATYNLICMAKTNRVRVSSEYIGKRGTKWFDVTEFITQLLA
jgi:hypothetical protein